MRIEEQLLTKERHAELRLVVFGDDTERRISGIEIEGCVSCLATAMASHLRSNPNVAIFFRDVMARAATMGPEQAIELYRHKNGATNPRNN